MTQFIRVAAVKPLSPPMVLIDFTNGEQREVDLSPYIATGPIFEPVRDDAAFFRAVQVEGGTIAWPNGADIDPDVLYYNGPPPWSQDYGETVHAGVL